MNSIPRITKIAISLLISGIILLIVSIIFTLQTVALSGLGLTFWGALFLIIAPKKYVEADTLSASSFSVYVTTDRIIKQFGTQKKGVYIPPYPEDAPLPEHLRGLDELVVFIPSIKENRTTPSIDDLVKDNFIAENPSGVLIIPPGWQLLKNLENSSKLNFAKVALSDLPETTQKTVNEHFCLAKEIALTIDNDKVLLMIKDSIFDILYIEGKNLQSLNFLGCPLVSLIACIIAKASGKPTVIHSINRDSVRKQLDVSYEILKR